MTKDRILFDSHIHISSANLNGSKSNRRIFQYPAERIAGILQNQMQSAGVEGALAMGSTDINDSDPLGIRATLEVTNLLPNIFIAGCADPTRTDSAHLRSVEHEIDKGHIKALKAYCGYSHFGPDCDNYKPYYHIARKYKIPIIFHTGDTHSSTAKLKFAHPLLVDDVAVDFPDVNFVMAHFGYPWLTDAAEVIYKNDNVWADLSGFVIGDDYMFEDPEFVPLLNTVRDDVRRAVQYTERCNRFIFGSDWPLVSIKLYLELIDSIFTGNNWMNTLNANAFELFNL